jgi:hypothetical protein
MHAVEKGRERLQVVVEPEPEIDELPIEVEPELEETFFDQDAR